MGQPGFFDIAERYEKLQEMGDPLEGLRRIIPWETFRPTLEKALREEERKSEAGRKPYDAVLMFKVLVLQSLYGLSDKETEYQLRDRLSFVRFLGLELEDRVPDEKTIWNYRDMLARKKTDKKLFEVFHQYLGQKGYKAQRGQIVDATLVEVPVQRNTREENEQIKKGETPAEWKKEPEKLRQKDVDARWLQKNGEDYYGYKSHINVDHRYKLIRKYEVTAASVHDSQRMKELLDKNNSNKRVWGDSAYRSKKTEKMLKKSGYKSRIHYKGARGQELTAKENLSNKIRSKVRARVEHVFGHQVQALGGKFSRLIGMVRNRWKIGMMNLIYNLSRYEWLLKIGKPKQYRALLGV